MDIWDEQPDRVDTEYHGLKCLVLKVPHSGHLCGYVGVDKTHILYEKSDSWDVDADSLEAVVNNLAVHGGVTFANKWNLHYKQKEKLSRKHKLEHKKLWFIGFDCAHSGDTTKHGDGGIYRDLPYVLNEVENLAKQIGEVLTNLIDKAVTKG